MLSALGGGVALRDDPDDAAYTSATTAQGILATEFARRASYLASMAISPLSCPTIQPIPLHRSTTAVHHDMVLALPALGTFRIFLVTLAFSLYSVSLTGGATCSTVSTSSLWKSLTSSIEVCNSQ